jgi:hypothetical protein
MAKTYEPIATTTLSSAASSVTFSSISGSYTDLVVIISALGNVGSPTDYGISLQINGDLAGDYSDTWLYGNGTSTVSSRRIDQSSIVDIQAAGYLSTTSPNPCVVNFLNYSNTTTYKTIISRGNNPSGGGGTATTEACVGLWRSTSAITSIKFLTTSGSYGSGSTFTLYGIKAA